jgi:broad specificity phosphatase PhoE
MGVIRLIRHGQASFGLKDYDNLSDIGKRQSVVLGESLKPRAGEIDLVVCGAMKRHRQTAELTLEAMGVTLDPVIDPRWNEYDHQEVVQVFKPAYKSRTLMAADLARTGDPRHAFQVMFEKALARWTGGENDGDYAEPWSAFSERSNAGLNSILENAGAGNVLVFTSGGPVSAVTAALLGLGIEGWQKLNRVAVNGAETKVVGGRSGVSVVSYNGHEYFESDRELLTYR